MQSSIIHVETAINNLRNGKMIILIDHPDRENEGDFIFPAENITPDIINFMIRNGSGIVCLSLMGEQLKKLNLNYMIPPHENTSQRNTPFTFSIEAKEGITTGVSAKDRATTILTAVKDNVCPEDIVRPGHVFPLHARDGGVLERPGHTEGAIDLVRLAGFQPAAVLCEVMNPDGTMAKTKDLQAFAKQHNLSILSIDDIIAYRRWHENLIADEVTSKLPIENYGMFNLSVVKEKYNANQHLILTKHNSKKQPTLVRIHSACVTGDLFASKRCDCHMQLQYSLQKISEEGGMLIYLDQEGRGIGLFNKIKSYSLQENGFDTVNANQHLGLPVDAREYYLAANILKNKNITHFRLLTNNPNKIADLKKYGMFTIQREEMPVFCNEYNQPYLWTKKHKLNHMIDSNFLSSAV